MTTRDSGLELPGKPGVWERKEGDWLLLTEYVRGLFRVVGFQGTERYRRTIDCPVHILPRGGWLPAVPAPALEGAASEQTTEERIEMAAKEIIGMLRAWMATDEVWVGDRGDIEAILRKHFRSPAEGAMVKGRQAKVITHPNLGAAITDGCFWLDRDGEWRIGHSWTDKYKFPDAEAAAAFLAQHADQPAAVAPGAPAEQGDESERLQSDLRAFRRESQHGEWDDSDGLDKLEELFPTTGGLTLTQSAAVEIKRLREQLAAAGKELAALRQLNIDHCADEERIKELALPILGEKRVNGEGYFVNSLQVVEMLVEQLAAAEKLVSELLADRDNLDTEKVTTELCEQFCKLDEDFQKAYGPGDEKPNLLKLRSEIFRTLYRHMPELLDAWQWMQLAGGYHERTPREVAIEQELNSGVAASESAERYLLDLVDAGRNRVHEEIGKREAAEAELASLKAAKGEQP